MMNASQVSDESTRLLLRSGVISTAITAASLLAFWIGRTQEPVRLAFFLGFVAFFALPGYAARTLCPFGGTLYYALPFLFNLLFYLCLVFGTLVLTNKPQRRIVLETLGGLLSLPILILFIVMHKDIPPAWPVLFVAATLAVAASFRNSKGWIYILPSAYVVVLLYISMHRVYLA